MATTASETTSVVKDLIQINTDRYNGFLKSAEDVEDIDLKELFNRFGQQSLNFKNELERLSTGAEPIASDDTSLGSKLHRAWIDVKSTFTGKDRHSVLAAAEYGEDQILGEYRDAIQNGSSLTSDVLAVIQQQKQDIQQAHNTIKALRDSSQN